MPKKLVPVLALILGLLSLSILLPLLSPQAEANVPARLLSFASAQQTSQGVRVSNQKFTNNGKNFFLMGVNYVGANDRAWEMWDKFDPNIINRDFQLASAAGLNTVRIFVMKTLRDEINANNFAKLDKVFELAGTNKLLVLLTFNDYDEPDLAKEAQLNKKIVARYATNPYLFGFDLKNEPQFLNIVAAIYPATNIPPLQKDDFIKAYGERMSQPQVDAWRQTTEGKSVVPARLDSKAGYIYANAYKLYVEFLDEAGKWTQTRSGVNTLDYIDSPDSGKWKGYLDALDGTVGAWITVRQAAVREVTPDVPVTIGWSNTVLAKMRSNQNLSFVALHRFPGEGYSALITTMKLMDNLQATFPGKPVTLEEFGYSNARSDGSAVPLHITASHEAALWLFLNSKGFAGGMKWMLANYPAGFNKVQNNYGLLDDANNPKPAYHAARAITSYIQSENYAPPGTLVDLKAEGSNVVYNYQGARGIFGNSINWLGGLIDYKQPVNSPFAAYWPPDRPGEVVVVATQTASVTVNLDQIYPQRNKALPVVLVTPGQPNRDLMVNSGRVSFEAQPGLTYSVRAPIQPPAFNRTTAIGGGAWYFNETGHNLKGAFLNYWLKNGGLMMFGFPLSEEFTENGYVVQYFERNRFEYHPEFAGTRYEVLLGLLGRDVTNGRGNEPPFQRIAPFQSNANSLYFPETGHSLSFGFRWYWERNGGLAQFGFPITEEFQELNLADGKTYTVQYFERARFEYHPEFKGTKFEVLLGLLGWQVVKGRGWI
jgi:hypothetical protein